MTGNLCYSFQNIAAWVWGIIKLAEEKGSSFSEETITDCILLQLRVQHPANVYIKAFSKKEEKVNGSDWEWWIGRRGMWFGMRIQAKRIKLPRETFEPLQSYKASKNPSLQIDNLINEANADKLNAAYCLYFMSKRQLHLGIDWCAMPLALRGCFIADASAVKAVGGNTLKKLAPVCVHWHHLVCHNGASTGGGGSAVLQKSRNGVMSGSPEIKLSDIPDFPTQSKLPDYMKYLREETGETGMEGDNPPLQRARERGVKGYMLIDTGGGA